MLSTTTRKRMAALNVTSVLWRPHTNGPWRKCNLENPFETNLPIIVKSIADVCALILKKISEGKKCIYTDKDANHSNIQSRDSLKLSAHRQEDVYVTQWSIIALAQSIPSGLDHCNRLVSGLQLCLNQSRLHSATRWVLGAWHSYHWPGGVSSSMSFVPPAYQLHFLHLPHLSTCVP